MQEVLNSVTLSKSFLRKRIIRLRDEIRTDRYILNNDIGSEYQKMPITEGFHDSGWHIDEIREIKSRLSKNEREYNNLKCKYPEEFI